MKPIRTVRSLRLRYAIGLSAIAILVTASFFTMQRVVSEQRDFSSLVNLAGHQSGLANRIAYFASLMVTTVDEVEFQMAKSQIGRTVNKMESAYKILREGSEEKGIPRIINDNLSTIYEDPMVGLDVALDNFLNHARAIYDSDMAAAHPGSASYLYLTTYGPHVLEPMLDAVVDEFQQIGRKAILKIERFELAVWLTTLCALLIEVAFIFLPAEKHIRKTIASLEETISELTKTHKRLLTAQQLALVGDWELQVKENKLHWSEQVYHICGVIPEQFEVTLENSLSIIHPQDRHAVKTATRKLLREKHSLNMEYRILRPDTTERLVLQQAVSSAGTDGSISTISATIQDITERKELSTRLEKLSENIPGFIFQFQINDDGTYKFQYVSKGITDTYGIPPESVLQNSEVIFNLVHNEDLARIRQSLHDSGRMKQTWHDQYRVQHPTKGMIWVEGHATPERLVDESILWYGYILDITTRKQSEEQIEQLALYDPLTGLANRRLLKDRLRQAMATARRNRTYGAVILLDLDNFKDLNDTQGHNVGDAQLIEVSKRIKNNVRDTDTVARLGGDEFVVILEWLGYSEDSSRNAVMAIAEKVRVALNQAYVLGPHSHVHHASASIGVTLFQGSEPSDGELLKRADVAMYEAKDLGRNRVSYFSKERQNIVDLRSEMASDLQYALNNDEFTLFYQPQFTIGGELCGAEALLRWNPTRKSPVSPDVFIPIAEETGLILPLGEWVLETACNDILLLEKKGLSTTFAIAINISARQFSDDGFLHKVSNLIDRSGVVVSRLKFELTESCLIKDLERAQSILSVLREMGIKIELDDFGTGYSSLNSLKNLPLDTLKIDRSLIHGIEGDPRDGAIVKAAIAMAKSLSLDVIAEGVETNQQRDFVVGEGCTMLQGFLFAKPAPLTDLVGFLEEHNQKVEFENLHLSYSSDVNTFVKTPH